MDLDALRTAARQQSFVTFTLTLADGRDLPIAKPEHLAIGAKRVIVIFEDDSWCVPEKLHHAETDEWCGNGAEMVRFSQRKTRSARPSLFPPWVHGW